MDVEAVLGVAAFVATAAVGAWAVRARRAPPALAALRGWAERAGHPTRGDGVDHPFEVIGEVGGRLYTVAFQRGRAVDGHPEDVGPAAGEAELPGGPRLSDGALVSRVWSPPLPLCADPLPAIEALVTAAADLELRVTARAPPE